MARGELSRASQARIHRAVTKAEKATGLELAVAVTKVADHQTRAHAQRAFHGHGLHHRPTVMVLLSLEHRRVEVVTSPEAASVVDDEAAARIVAAIAAAMPGEGLAAAIEAGLAVLVDEVTAARR